MQCKQCLCWMLEAGGLGGGEASGLVWSGWGKGTEFVTSPHRTAPHHMPACMANGETPARGAGVGGSGRGHGDGQHAVWPRHSLPHDARSRSGRWRPSASASGKLDLAASQPQPRTRGPTLPLNMVVGGYSVRILQQRASRTLQPAPFTAGLCCASSFRRGACST